MGPIMRPCGRCGGSGAIGGGYAYCDGYASVDRCDGCDGAGELPVTCDCGSPAVHSETDGLLPVCEECAPGGCAICRVFGRACCKAHRAFDRNAAAAVSRGFRPELKVLAGERPAFAELPTAALSWRRIRCEACCGGGDGPHAEVCCNCNGEGWVRVPATGLADLGEDQTQETPAFVDPAHKEVA